jgi:hypothetical protein
MANQSLVGVASGIPAPANAQIMKSTNGSSFNMNNLLRECAWFGARAAYGALYG